MRMSIKAKLFTGFGIILFFLATMGYILTQKLSESNDRLTEIVNLSSRKVSLSHQILSHVLDAGRQEKNIILENDPTKISQYIAELRTALAAIDTKSNDLGALVDDEGDKILNRFTSNWGSYKVELERIINLALQNKDQEAYAISSTSGYTVREEAQTSLNQLVNKNEESMLQDKLRNDESYQSSIIWIITVVAASLVISIAVAIWIVIGIGKRISHIAKSAERIASREHTDEKIEDASKDELSSILDSLERVNQSFREITVNADSVASGNYSLDFKPRSEKDVLGNSLKRMTISLRETTEENRRNNWLTTGQNKLNERLRGDQTVEELSSNILNHLCEYVDAVVGALYVSDDDNTLNLVAKHALSDSGARRNFKWGEGLVGRVAADQKFLALSNVEEEELFAQSSVLNLKPREVFILPLIFEGKTLGVVEIAHRDSFSSEAKSFLLACAESIAISINSANARKRIQQLLEETQVQSEELQSQQEELRQINEELEEQAQSLKQQQEELQMTNEELEEQTQELEARNKEVEQARKDIEQKTRQLEVSSKYKSEFLANMSHELRTPLNSLLILSKDLADNGYGNLSSEQVESAEIIHKSGQDLLALINEVLDLSKIEAGKMSLHPEALNLEGFVNEIYRDFRHSAEHKSLKFEVSMGPDLPASITTDAQRLKQILKNLLSNAIKFTEHGQVRFDVKRNSSTTIAFTVSDTGIGIPEEKQLSIFEAFQQADGGTSRKYGGTGLGLSISRELAKLLSGEIYVSSKVNEGSSFTVIIPIEIGSEVQPMPVPEIKTAPTAKLVRPTQSESFRNYPSIEDDRSNVKPEDKLVLIIEDDLNFATVLRNQAREKGFKCLVASTGEDGLAVAAKFRPHAIMLDIDLPGMDGHQVLAELKLNLNLRHIPVHIISVNERSLDPIKNGAVEFLTKPINKRQVEEVFSRIESFIQRKMKNLLIIEDDKNSRIAIRKLIGNGDVHTMEAASGEEAIDLFMNNHIDCMVMDLGLPDISGFELIHRFLESKKKVPPIIVYTGRELTKKENEELEKYAETIIIKGTKSEERLLDETALFLHRTIENLPASKQHIITNLYDKEAVFNGRKVLLVDDDMRNVFALSKILKGKEMTVIKAENGISCLNELHNDPGIDIILMDIMMPEMDGYEAMRRIRSEERFARLPIIALTAKAMKDDKQKCIDAGANDYITKPVDVERLLSLMRVWLSK